MTEIIIALIGALAGGGLTGVFAWRAVRRKAEGEATQTEADAMKSVQDVYQQALEDQQKYISQLRDTRDHLVTDREEMRRENNELRKRLNDMDNKVRQLEHDVARYGPPASWRRYGMRPSITRYMAATIVRWAWNSMRSLFDAWQRYIVLLAKFEQRRCR